MWIMTKFGILMPAARPRGTYAAADDLLTMQVRSRSRHELDEARKLMLARNMEVSEIVATPEKDYDFRFYCAPDDFAQIIAQMIEEIDFVKFKPTTGKTIRGRNLYELYEHIWFVVYDHYKNGRDVAKSARRRRV